jgi:hypothetical protein
MRWVGDTANEPTPPRTPGKRVPGEDSNSARKRWKASVVPVGRDPFVPDSLAPSREPRVQGEVAAHLRLGATVLKDRLSDARHGRFTVAFGCWGVTQPLILNS